MRAESTPEGLNDVTIFPCPYLFISTKGREPAMAGGDMIGFV